MNIVALLMGGSSYHLLALRFETLHLFRAWRTLRLGSGWKAKASPASA
jgi:hypothetical protein